MLQENDLSKADCKNLAIQIRENIFRPANTYKTTIFLCGADISQKDKLRYKIATGLGNWFYSFQYDLIYPEDIFEELLYSSQTKDLLSLENLLADSVDAIVLIPESPGSFAELGAFANDARLRNKLICIVDEKYKKHKSFINQGPLKLVKNVNKHGVIFINPDDIPAAIEKLNASLRKVKKTSSKVGNKISLLQLENFLLPAIFLLEPVTKATLTSLVSIATEDDKNAFQTTTTALTISTKKRYIELTAQGYKLTLSGVNEFLSFRKISSRIKTQDKTVAIDNLKLEILNLKNRKKKLKA